MDSIRLEEQSALLGAVFARSPDGMAFLDRNLVIRAANESFARQIGRSLDSVIGRSGEEVMPGWWGQVGHIYRDVAETRRPFQDSAYPYRFEDQPERGLTYWDSSVSPILGPEGGLLGYLLLHREVTERMKMERALRENETRFRLVATNIPNTIFFQDRDLRYVWIFNPARPLEESDVVGKTDHDLLPRDEAERRVGIKTRVLATGTGTRAELQLSPGGVRRWYEAVYEPWRDPRSWG